MNENRNKSRIRMDKSASKSDTKAATKSAKFKKYAGSRRRKPNAELTDDTQRMNDPAWYGSNMIANASSNLFFSQRFGDVIKDILPSDYVSQMGWTAENPYYRAIPGIMTLHVTPSFGEGGGYDSPINIAAQAIYSFVRHENSGSRNYDTPDLMTYILAMGDVYSYIVMLQRVYGYINRYYPQNSYFARAVVEAMGVDFDSIQGNMSQFAYYINVLISKACAFAVPNDFSYFQRKVFMYRDIFIESDNIKDQLYMFVPDGFYRYTVDDAHPEAYLKFIKFWSYGSNRKTLTDLVTYGNDLIQALLDNEDAGLCCGDIIKAYKADVIKLTEMPLNYTLNPVVGDDNLFYQIRNATVCSTYVPSDLHQDATKLFLEYDPIVQEQAASIPAASAIYLMTGNRLLTSNKMDPTAADVMESTRLMVQFADPDLTEDGHVIANAVCGTEVVTGLTVYTRVEHMDTHVKSVLGRHYNNNLMATSIAGIEIPLITAFKYHPTFLTFATIVLNSSTTKYQGVLQECETITTVDQRELYNIHQAALLNMLAVPSIGRL